MCATSDGLPSAAGWQQRAGWKDAWVICWFLLLLLFLASLWMTSFPPDCDYNDCCPYGEWPGGMCFLRLPAVYLHLYRLAVGHCRAWWRWTPSCSLSWRRWEAMGFKSDNFTTDCVGLVHKGMWAEMLLVSVKSTVPVTLQYLKTVVCWALPENCFYFCSCTAQSHQHIKQNDHMSICCCSAAATIMHRWTARFSHKLHNISGADLRMVHMSACNWWKE